MIVREAVVGEHLVGFPCVFRDTARACRRSDRAECDGALARDDSDLRETVAERAVEEQFPPGAFGFGLDWPPTRRSAVDVEGEMVAADGDRTEEEAVTGELGIQSACSLGERNEAHVPGSESDAGADGRDVVEVVPEPFQLEQDGAGAGDLGGRAEAENLFAGLRVGERVGDSARGAGPSGVGDAFGERLSHGCPLEAAVFVEEPRVEMEDPGRRRRGSGSGRIRLRLRGSVRPRPGRCRRRAPAPSTRERSRLWSISGRIGSWPSKAYAVQVGCLGLVPVRYLVPGRRSSARGRCGDADALEAGSSRLVR